MDIMFLDDAWQDYLYWQKIDKKIVKRINQLILELVTKESTNLSMIREELPLAPL